ncbi:4119_t:CDS:2 [Dentiscutata erythropus]|uniref:4119_t:CDS:1 n=1 Tax=Dentiscutata erythropus TaxID=1348616 RepID=A0A9N9N6V7_9GLOM|nr:4119_t:CDS:2 [Dentiscutata erythropus]
MKKHTFSLLLAVFFSYLLISIITVHSYEQQTATCKAEPHKPKPHKTKETATCTLTETVCTCVPQSGPCTADSECCFSSDGCEFSDSPYPSPTGYCRKHGWLI